MTVSGTRAVRTVEAVEQLSALFLRQLIALIADAQEQMVALFRKENMASTS